MSIVIDDPALDALAQTLAAQRGESIAEVIRHALEMQLAELQQTELAPLQTRAEKRAFMQNISHRFIASLKEPMSSTDTDDLYDAWGLPK